MDDLKPTPSVNATSKHIKKEDVVSSSSVENKPKKRSEAPIGNRYPEGSTMQRDRGRRQETKSGDRRHTEGTSRMDGDKSGVERRSSSRTLLTFSVQDPPKLSREHRSRTVFQLPMKNCTHESRGRTVLPPKVDSSRDHGNRTVLPSHMKQESSVEHGTRTVLLRKHQEPHCTRTVIPSCRAVSQFTTCGTTFISSDDTQQVPSLSDDQPRPKRRIVRKPASQPTENKRVVVSSEAPHTTKTTTSTRRRILVRGKAAGDKTLTKKQTVGTDIVQEDVGTLLAQAMETDTEDEPVEHRRVIIRNSGTDVGGGDKRTE